MVDAREAENKIKTDPFNELVFRNAGDQELYLVGGYIRDLLRDRRSRDRDYVVRGAVEKLAMGVARASGGRSLKLGREGLHRIILKDAATLDFNPLRGDIERDLSLRDFTINAIAWSPGNGWIDPQRGMDDLEQGVIRMVSARNLEHDPLRLLRAYRISAELSFDIEPSTRSSLRAHSFLIAQAKRERITSEFFKILNLNNAPDTVAMLLKDGLLPYLIACSYYDLEKKVKALYDVYRRSFDAHLKYRIKLQDIFSQGLRHIGLLGLEVLLENLPEHLFVLSSRTIKRIFRLNKASQLFGARPQMTLNREILFDIFEAAGEAAQDFLLIRDMPAREADLGEFIRIRRSPLLTTEEIMAATECVSGPRIGKAVRTVMKAEFAGRIGAVKDAIEFLSEGQWEGR